MKERCSRSIYAWQSRLESGCRHATGRSRPDGERSSSRGTKRTEPGTGSQREIWTSRLCRKRSSSLIQKKRQRRRERIAARIPASFVKCQGRRVFCLSNPNDGRSCGEHSLQSCTILHTESRTGGAEETLLVSSVRQICSPSRDLKRLSHQSPSQPMTTTKKRPKAGQDREEVQTQ